MHNINNFLYLLPGWASKKTAGVDRHTGMPPSAPPASAVPAVRSILCCCQPPPTGGPLLQGHHRTPCIHPLVAWTASSGSHELSWDPCCYCFQHLPHCNNNNLCHCGGGSILPHNHYCLIQNQSGKLWRELASPTCSWYASQNTNPFRNLAHDFHF